MADYMGWFLKCLVKLAAVFIERCNNINEAILLHDVTLANYCVVFRCLDALEPSGCSAAAAKIC